MPWPLILAILAGLSLAVFGVLVSKGVIDFSFILAGIDLDEEEED